VKSWAAAVPAALLALAGCRSVPSAVPLPPGDQRPDAFLASLADREQGRQALRGVARVALEGPAGNARSKQILVVERPARLRVEVQGPFFNQLVAVLVSDGARFELFRAQDRSVERGVMDPALLYRVSGIPLRPADAVEMLLGVPPIGGALMPGSAMALSNGLVRIDLLDEGRILVRRVEFDSAAQLRRVEVRTVDGELAWEARYDDYRSVGGALFAHDIALEFPLTGSRAKISFQHVELNPELSPEVFVLGLPATREGESG
jgi:hypothetical protein